MELDHIMLFDGEQGIDVDFFRLDDGNIKIICAEKLNRSDLYGPI